MPPNHVPHNIVLILAQSPNDPHDVAQRFFEQLNLFLENSVPRGSQLTWNHAGFTMRTKDF